MSTELYIKTLTPVHVGGSAEKNYSEGIDYIAKNGKVYFLDEKKIINKGILSNSLVPFYKCRQEMPAFYLKTIYVKSYH